jgi:hypothetical protein
MTDCSLASTPVTDRTLAPTRRTRRPDRRRPAGIPRWLWLLGVAVVPVSAGGQTDRSDDAAQGWVVVSAGGGTTHVAAVFCDGPDPRS